MARPKSKSELLKLSADNFLALMNYVNQLAPIAQEGEFPKGTLNRNVRDVLAHLYHWHLMMMEWHDEGMAGNNPPKPAKGYTWKTTPELNKWIWEKYSSMSLNVAKKRLKNSHKKVMDTISNYSDKELFEKKRYPWTGSTSMGSYFISATSSHYDWALKLITKATKIKT